MASEPIAKLLDGNAEIKLLAAQLEHIKRLQRRYRTISPGQLAEASRVCAIDGKTVVICAANGPVAAALRQLAPRLLEGLRQPQKSSKHPEDQELTSIRIEVQVEVKAPRRQVVARPPIPRERLGQLAATLSDSPLKEELEKMSGQSRKARSRT
jgi:hypothetical protein